MRESDNNTINNINSNAQKGSKGPNPNIINEEPIVNPLNFRVKLTREDFRVLAFEHIDRSPKNAENPAVKDWEKNFNSYKTDEERTRGFLVLMDVDPNSWELKDNQLLPVEIRNSGDINKVQNYLDKNINNMTVLSKAVLIKRLDTLHKERVIQDGFAGEKIAEGIVDNRPELVKDDANSQKYNDYESDDESDYSDVDDEEENEIEGFTPLREKVEDIEYYDFTGSPEQQAEKIEEMYNGIEKPEDKMEFLVNIESYYLMISRYPSEEKDAKNNIQNIKIPDVILDKIDELQDKFKADYVHNKSEATVGKLLDKYFSMRAQVYTDSISDYNKIYKTLPDTEDQKIREAKALYYAKHNDYNNSKLHSLGSFGTTILQDEYCNDLNIDEEIAESFKINKETKMSDVAKYLGYKTPDEINKFCQNYDATSDDSVITVFKNQIANINDDKNKIITDEEVEGQFYTELKKAKISRYKELAEGRFLKNAGYPENYLTAEINPVFITNIKGEYNPPITIKEWIDNTGNKLVEDARNVDMLRLARENKEQYILNTEKNKNKMSAKINSVNRIKRASSKSYGWLLNIKRDKDGNVLSRDLNDPELAEKYKEYRYDTHDYIGKEATDKVIKKSMSLWEEELIEKIRNVDDISRDTAFLNIFNMWVLGTKDGVSISNIAHFSDNKEWIREFADFCENHPTRRADNTEVYKESVGIWNNILLKATNEIKKYKLPKINYDKPNEVEKHAEELLLVKGLISDIKQEIPSIFGNTLNLDGIQVSEDLMGTENKAEMMNSLAQMHEVFSFIDAGYFKPYEPTETTKLFTNFISNAVNRSVCANLFNKYAGKDLNTVIRETGDINATYSEQVKMFNGIYDEDGKFNEKYKDLPKIELKTFMKYLNGKDIKTFKKQFKEYEQRIIKEAKKEVDNLSNESLLKGFLKDLNMNELKQPLLNLGDNAEDVINFVNSEEKLPNSDYTGMTMISKTMNTFLDENYRNLLTRAGIEKKDALLIDGKTAEELWGKKYEGVQDKATREHCYEVELFKMLAAGKGTITARNITFGSSNKIANNDNILVSLPDEEMKELKHNYDIYNYGVKKIISELKYAQDKLLKTHPDYDEKNPDKAKNEIGKVGTTLFRNMEKSLNECILMFENNNYSGYTPDDITRKILEVREASKTYFNKRNTLFSAIFGKRSDSGEKRLRVSEDIKNGISDLLLVYKSLRQGMAEKLQCNTAYTFKNAPIRYIDDTMEALSKPEMEHF
ncbi:MAG: hypothetical protein K6G11_02780 [Lachnospiraceae bacterium]|nr:hypothetical protein [Lachnospiraceae bacterium]